MVKPVATLAELAALLALAQDHALGQPPGAQLRAAVLAQDLSRVAGLDRAGQGQVWWCSTLRFLGCTGHAFDMAVVFGDEIEMRGRAARADFADPFDMLRLMLSEAGSEKSGLSRLRSVLAVLSGGRQAAEMNFRTACEVADVFAKRLGLDEAVLDALRHSFERWNGRGLPSGVKGAAIPPPMRIAQVAHEYEVLARIEGSERARAIVSARSGKAYDPALVEIVLRHGESWWRAVREVDPWDAALDVAPDCGPLDPDALKEAFLVVADFADIKSPWTAGHSRAVAALVVEICGPGAEAPSLLHDLGRVGVPNSIWDKPGPLTRDERNRVETHALLTDQMLRRLSLAFGPVAASAHERSDGSGYHRRATGGQLDLVQRVLAAADCYQAMTSNRPYRPALSREEAAGQLRSMASGGQLDGEAVERVLESAGHPRRSRVERPGGLTAREAEVLRLLALGLTTRDLAQRLSITPKTADHHIQSIYSKIGVSTRGAAALFAVEHGVLPAETYAV